MRAVLTAAAAALLACFASLSVEAHSVRRNPLRQISTIEQPIIHSRSHRLHSHSSFDLTFSLDDDRQKIRLSLEPNHDVIADSATISYLGPDGTVERWQPIERTDHKVYKGHTFVQHPAHSEWIRTGFARITVYKDGPEPLFEGVFRVNGNHHHIKTSSTFRRTRLELDPDIPQGEPEHMILWRDTDVLLDPRDAYGELRRGLGSTDSVCSSDGLHFNKRDVNPFYPELIDNGTTSVLNTKSLFGRQSDVPGGGGPVVDLESTIGSTEGCPSTRKVALMGVAVDCTYRQDFDTEDEMRDNIVQVVNDASALYEETFNISLGLANLTVNEPECPGSPPASSQWNVDCTPDVDIFERLNLFSEWRGQWTDSNAFWTLLTTCETGSAVGLAWLGQLCAVGATTQEGESGSGNETFAGANVIVRTDTEWQVLAHEIGHTFGAVHDCTSSTCGDGTVDRQQCCPLSTSGCDADGEFMMNPSTSNAITQFSPCTIGNICSSMGTGRVASNCLTDNRNVATITGAICGNGIVEEDEECDCGGELGCADNPCCDGSTCTFVGAATCDFANEDCCTDQCQFASQGEVCRASSGSCDPEETCPGNAATCPEDVKSDDGASCGGDGSGLTCASGQCTSRDLQCQATVGSSFVNETSACNPDECILACSSPSLGDQPCYNMQQYFLDGTPCGSGGSCYSGQCQGSNIVNQALAWLRENQDIVIPVASVVGGLIVIALLWCCISTCIRKRKSKKAAAAKAAAAAAAPTPPNGNEWRRGSAFQSNQVRYPPPTATSHRSPPPSHRGPPPPISTPAMSQSGSRLWQDDPYSYQQPAWGANRRGTARYA